MPTISALIRNGQIYNICADNACIQNLYGTGADGDCVIDSSRCICAKEYNFKNLTICPNVKLQFCGTGVPYIKVTERFCNMGTLDLRTAGPMCAACVNAGAVGTIYTHASTGTINLCCGAAGNGGGKGQNGGSNGSMQGGLAYGNNGGGGAGTYGAGNNATPGCGGNGGSGGGGGGWGECCGGMGGPGICYGGGPGGFGCYYGGRGGDGGCCGGAGGRGGDSIYCSAGDGGSGTIHWTRYSSSPGGDGGNSRYGNGGNGGNGGNDDCYTSSGGKGGDTYYGNGGAGGRGGNTNCYGGSGGNGGNVYGGMYGLIILSREFYNNSIIGCGGTGGAGGSAQSGCRDNRGTAGCGGRGGAGSDMAIYYSCLINKGTICYKEGKGGLGGYNSSGYSKPSKKKGLDGERGCLRFANITMQ